MSKPNEKRIRNAAIRADRAKGMTYREIGVKYVISAKRARQIVEVDWHRESQRRRDSRRRAAAKQAETTSEGQEAA
jgi:Mor family transcriptional regulator